MQKQTERGGWGRVRRVVMLLLAAIFLVSVGAVVMIRMRERDRVQFYEETVQQYTSPAQPAAAGAAQESGAPPIAVDFDALCAANSDIVGWIYCADTEINYPVLHGATNDTYLRRDYEKKSSTAGSIFLEAQNQPDFSDANTIIYGHNMADGSMFAALQKWQEQAFCEAHPVLWLLTPTQNYQIEIYSAYTTSAYSETYSIFSGPCEQLDAYVQMAVQQSAPETGVTPAGDARHVLLTTCASAYGNDDARHVLHGMLRPVE